MDNFTRKNYWENIYGTKQLNEVSWYQPTPHTSLDFIQKDNPSKNSSIIDIGGGDSFLIDNLIDQNYSNLSVLDISKNAIVRAKTRLGNKSDSANWIVADITDFKPQTEFDIWHDRAAFHFLTESTDIEKYISVAGKGIAAKGKMIIGTFSKDGPTKCSGIEIKQYSVEELAATFQNSFELIESKIIQHPTPFDTTQEFVFCSFLKK